MEAVEALLGTVRVSEPRLRVHELGPGTVSLATGARWAFVALARGEVGLPDATLGPGDAVLTRDRGALAARVADGGATVLVAEFDLPQAVDRVLPPPVDVVVPADSEMCRVLVEQLGADLDSAAGQGVVSVRLLDWLVTSLVRDVLVTGTAAAPTGPGVARALSAVHADPGAAWTVEGLARRAGMGRAAFARRFRDDVGVSPLAYVREHRLGLAERALLDEPDATVAAIARRVGYANAFSFSTAFRRHRGRPPSELRAPAPS